MTALEMKAARAMLLHNPKTDNPELAHDFSELLTSVEWLHQKCVYRRTMLVKVACRLEVARQAYVEIFEVMKRDNPDWAIPKLEPGTFECSVPVTEYGMTPRWLNDKIHCLLNFNGLLRALSKMYFNCTHHEEPLKFLEKELLALVAVLNEAESKTVFFERYIKAYCQIADFEEKYERDGHLVEKQPAATDETDGGPKQQLPAATDAPDQVLA